MKVHSALLSISIALLCTILSSCGQDQKRLDGHWKLIPEKSASIDPWSHLDLDIDSDGSHVTVVKRYNAGNALDRRTDSMTVNMHGNEETVSVPPGRWLGEVSMGIYYGPGTQRHVVGRMNDAGDGLQIDMRETLQTAQGSVDVEVKEVYVLASNGSTLKLSETRSTRTSGPPLKYTFGRVTQ